MKIVITFQVMSLGEGDVDSHQRQFEFKGTFEEAKKFLDDVMKQRIETQEKNLPF